MRSAMMRLADPAMPTVLRRRDLDLLGNDSQTTAWCAAKRPVMPSQPGPLLQARWENHGETLLCGGGLPRSSGHFLLDLGAALPSIDHPAWIPWLGSRFLLGCIPRKSIFLKHGSCGFPETYWLRAWRRIFAKACRSRSTRPPKPWRT